MLYETLAQPAILLYVLIVGFLSGIVFDCATFLFVVLDKNKVVRFILDFLATILAMFILFVLILKISYGELRLWHILFFSMALFLERATIGKLVAKGIMLCYNFVVKILRKCLSKLQNYRKKRSAGNDKKII